MFVQKSVYKLNIKQTIVLLNSFISFFRSFEMSTWLFFKLKVIYGLYCCIITKNSTNTGKAQKKTLITDIFVPTIPAVCIWCYYTPELQNTLTQMFVYVITSFTIHLLSHFRHLREINAL